ncbi:UvrD-helicase domain-containing protein [Ferrimonas sp. SCSIO 43195]|uniref:UvrD-helicase domain-containing protein n=1 Tax=Ferrimonas sp. SCSIO 43195 TaxID=2822844 RepID=UPI002075F9BA|nr:UvrD-helicase domain-containing protein [Ferrimonas sp. SCSIO 43195]USD35668.1 UvrD-helicase domain-containing protein [Ferrimonas sp. SCSIO 43195]
MLPLKRTLLGRLLSLSSLEIHADTAGLTLVQGKRRQQLQWQQITRPVQLDSGLLFTSARIEADNAEQRHFWLSKRQAQAWLTATNALWLSARAPLLKRQAASLTACLQSGYMPCSRWQQLVADAAEMRAMWPDSLSKDDLALEYHGDLGLIQQLSDASPATLRALRQHSVDTECRRYQALFDTIESSPLTPKQRIACVTHNDHNLVIAGAGSGKTSTLIGRVAYLLESGQARAEEIVILAYGKQAAQELSERLAKRLGQRAKAVTCTTFHALGLAIIRQTSEAPPTLSPLAGSASLRQSFVSEQISTRLKQVEFKRATVKVLESDPSLHPNAGVLPLYRQLKNRGLDLNARLLFWQQQGAVKRLLTLLADLLLEFKGHRGRLGSVSRRELDLLTPLLIPLLEAYNRQLRLNNEIDYIDMIDQAHRAVRSGRFTSEWRHLLVDEFQDISRARAMLLRSLSRNARSLFAVGDDWQSIYRFSGSDVSLMTGFSDFFGPTSTTLLDKTFRFDDHLNRLASAFISKNPAQLPKTMTTHKRATAPSLTLVSNQQPLTELVQAIASRVKSGQSVYFLARFKFQLPDTNSLAALANQFPQLHFRCDSVHASKGRQADIVVLLIPAGDQHGFPPSRRSHPAKEAMLAAAESYPHAEERRLFYVALTRASDHLYLVTDPVNPGPFVTELRELMETPPKPTAN